MTSICGIIGDPVEHSLSPTMHNAGYKNLGLDFEYKKFHVVADNLPSFIERIKNEHLRGISVTIPHKENVIAHLDEIDEVAKKIGAVNTIVNTDGVLKGYNTDWIGCMQALEEKTEIVGKKVALLGAGGSARAIAYGIHERKGELTIFNRTLEKAQSLAEEINASYDILENFSAHNHFDIIINSTSVGMGNMKDQSPIVKESIPSNCVVQDIVYSPLETQLLKDASSRGAQVVYGYKMLLYQGIAQFELFTHKKAPIEVMEQAIIPNES